VVYTVCDNANPANCATATLHILVQPKIVPPIINESFDVDGDGVNDDQEITDGTDPNNTCDYKISSQDLTKVTLIWKNTDCDQDGLTNSEEVLGTDNPSTPINSKGIKTDPRNPDSDGDGVSDGQEAIDGTNPNDGCNYKVSSQVASKVSLAWSNSDCDSDGLTNGEELTGIDNPSTPANPKGIKTNPLNKDSDGDGVSDSQEALDGTNPNDSCSFKLASQTLTPSASWSNADCDGDGVTNAKEKADGTNPLNGCEFKVASRTITPSDTWKNGDCDGDGLKNEGDGIEDCDKDGTPNFLDPDTCKVDIVMANVFTPNGDGINDVIKPILIGIDKFVCFKVYNRWGNLIFDTVDPDKAWDGSIKESGQGTETFQWYSEGYDRNGNLIRRAGMVTLIR
jgi:gliding motility-associated-like protein